MFPNVPNVRTAKRTVGAVCEESLQAGDSIPIPYSKGYAMNSIVYIVGAVVIIVAILGFLGLR